MPYPGWSARSGFRPLFGDGDERGGAPSPLSPEVTRKEQATPSGEAEAKPATTTCSGCGAEYESLPPNGRCDTCDEPMP